VGEPGCKRLEVKSASVSGFGAAAKSLLHQHVCIENKCTVGSGEQTQQLSMASQFPGGDISHTCFPHSVSSHGAWASFAGRKYQH